MGDTHAVTVAGLYLPNGNPIGTDKFVYKLAWFERLQNHARELLALEDPPTAILCGNNRMAIGAYDAVRDSRLALCALTLQVLSDGLGLLGIETPEKM